LLVLVRVVAEGDVGEGGLRRDCFPTVVGLHGIPVAIA
jgi:hypothetical protein